MGYKHTEEEILQGALATAFESGLSQLTFARVAKTLDTSDRVVVYYFPSKDELVSAVLMAVGLELQVTLGQAFTEPSTNHHELASKAWPVLSRPEADAVFALFFEATGLAAAGREPYASLVPQLIEAWISWAAEFIQSAPDPRGEAAAAIAMIDGLLLLRQTAGPEEADRAASRLGL